MSGWDRFRKQQAAEREQLRRLFVTMQTVLSKCPAEPPTEVELSALAAMLHSFYTGLENIFKRVAVELDAQSVRGEAWHRNLLRQMSVPTSARPAVVSAELHETLLDFLRFRRRALQRVSRGGHNLVTSRLMEPQRIPHAGDAGTGGAASRAR